jgi:hypothetical protein
MDLISGLWGLAQPRPWCSQGAAIHSLGAPSHGQGAANHSLHAASHGQGAANHGLAAATVQPAAPRAQPGGAVTWLAAAGLSYAWRGRLWSAEAVA